MNTLGSQPVRISGTTPALRPVTLGVIVGNRGFFPHHLALSGRKTISGEPGKTKPPSAP